MHLVECIWTRPQNQHLIATYGKQFFTYAQPRLGKLIIIDQKITAIKRAQTMILIKCWETRLAFTELHARSACRFYVYIERGATA